MALKRLSKEYMKQAKKLGLLDQKNFKDALDAYNFQVELAEMLRQSIKEIGTMVSVPVGSKDREKLDVNPAIKALNATETQGRLLRGELDKKLTEAAKTAEIEGVNSDGRIL